MDKTYERSASPKAVGAYNITWDAYYRHAEINQFLFDVAALYEYANVVQVGVTYEGRDLLALELKKSPFATKNVYLESGTLHFHNETTIKYHFISPTSAVHAREWIAPAVATYTIRELVENYDLHPQYLEEINWYIIPISNPDGYEYSWDEERLWRKNREPNADSPCTGTDLNRNFPFHWAGTYEIISLYFLNRKTECLAVF